jgi:hypothetical protein
LGIGEALVTVLDEKGIPTPLVHTYLTAPLSRMDIITEAEMEAIISQSELVEEYNEEINRQSAYEILSNKLTTAPTVEHKPIEVIGERAPNREIKEETSTAEKVLNHSTTKMIFREVLRGFLGVLGLSSSTRKKRRNSTWF